MDRTLVYTKTPAGEEATRQRTRVVQRNLRMVLLQVDGQLNVDGLVGKIGNDSLVFGALQELEKGGYIALSSDAPSVWQQSVLKVKKISAKATAQVSQYSNFGPSQAEPLDQDSFEPSIMDQASTFGKAKKGNKVAAPAKAEPSASNRASASDVRALPPVSHWVKPKSTFDKFEEGLSLVVGRVSGLFASKEKPSEKQVSKPAARDLAPYKRKSWPRRIVGAVLVFLLAAFLTLLFYPYNNHRAAIDASLTGIVGMPVRVGSVGVEFSPLPSLVLRDVHLGEAGEAVIGSVLVPQLLSLHGSGNKVITEAEIRELSLSPDFLVHLPRLFKGVRENQKLALERLLLSKVTLSYGGVALTDMEGEMNLKPSEGHPVGLALATADKALRLNFAPSASGVEVVIESQGWKPSEKSPYEFSSISSKGLLQPGKLSLNDAEFGMAQGVFKGSWSFEWGKESLSMSANGALANVDTRKLLTTFSVPLEMDGRLSGNLLLTGNGKNWQAMWNSVDAILSVDVERGVLSGVDLGEAMRRGLGKEISGGQTRFDHLWADLSIAPEQVSSKNFRLESGMVKVNGRFVAKSDHSVVANLQMNIHGSTLPIQAPLRVSGKLPVLQTVVEP